ncbi:hypothetical protein D3C83_203840 [compost metagenome]
MKPDSSAVTPEHLYKERGFILYLGFVVVLLAAAFVVEIPWLHWFLTSAFTRQH